MKLELLNFLINHNIPFSLGQVKGKYEAIKIPYQNRAEYIEFLKKKRIKLRDIDYSEDMKHVTLVFEKGSKI